MTDPRHLTDPTITQLGRVFDAMRDGAWRSPAEIAAITNDSPQSIPSRLRDLRLPRHGNYQVDLRKRNASQQIWEYRLVLGRQVSNQSPFVDWASSNMMGITGIQFAPSSAAPPPTNSSSRPSLVKFLNMQTMQVEYIPKDCCRVDNSDGFERVVAVDSDGEVLSHLATPQYAL